MSKKKREHIVFDNMNNIKKNIPFKKVNNKTTNKKSKNIAK